MRGLVAVAALCVMTLSGCLDAGEVFGNDPDTAPCTEDRVAHTYWLSDGLYLRPEEPSGSGSTPGNSFSNAFVTDTADEWWSEAMEDGIRILGDVTLDLWVERTGSPAVFTESGDPAAGDPGDPTSGWQLFSQFGSEHGFAPDYHNVYSDTFVEPGTVEHYTQTFTMPEGGLVLEHGDHLRLLLTSLVPATAEEGSHNILWGEDTPSAVSFEAVCYIDRSWEFVDAEATDISLAGNQGLLTGAVPEEEGFNVQSVPFTVDAATERLTITLEQNAASSGAPKNDMDVVIMDADGEQVWSVGSPYADETGRLWKANLDAFMPPGDYTAQVHSYSGKDYEGSLSIMQETSIR